MSQKTRSSSSPKRSELAAHPDGGPMAKAEMSTADCLGSREGSSRAGPPQGWG